ncbi:MAG: glutathione S-transferase family protein [Planctomycetota bacterium]|jgi:putative glutathione S-transferase
MSQDARRNAEFPAEQSNSGEFVRQESVFRRWVGRDVPVEAGRYHLYVSLACPWAHRVVIARRLLELEQAIGLTVVDPIRDGRGWAFREGRGHTLDPLNGFEFLSEAYARTDSSFDGRVTVPVLWDKASGQIVNNESSEVLRMLGSVFRELSGSSLDIYPEAHREEIDRINARVYDNVNNGVYRSGFATSQAAYESAVTALFATLDELETRLAGQRFLAGDALTEADIRLFTTLVRFDAVYHGHFKCNVRRIADYEHLFGYLRDLYQTPGFGETVDFDHIKRHYYVTHGNINPTRIVPVGPDQDLEAPHDRSQS